MDRADRIIVSEATNWVRLDGANHEPIWLSSEIRELCCGAIAGYFDRKGQYIVLKAPDNPVRRALVENALSYGRDWRNLHEVYATMNPEWKTPIVESMFVSIFADKAKEDEARAAALLASPSSSDEPVQLSQSAQSAQSFVVNEEAVNADTSSVEFY